MKSYRARNLTQRCQIAKTEDGINPLRDEKGNLLLDHGGLWFLKVSGAENHDNKRLIPQDYVAFLKVKANEIEEALKAEGVADVTVTPEDVYNEYVGMFTKPSGTYAPAGHPEEFSLVMPKQLCVNWAGGGGSGSPSIRRIPSVAPQATSIFARIKAAREQANNQPAPSTNRKPKVAG